jgi:hypothetical protein
MIRSEIAIAMLAAGSLFAQSQAGTTAKAVEQKEAGAARGITVSGGTASPPAPKNVPAEEVPQSNQLVLPGCEAIRHPREVSNRDYSTPSSRLVGRWTSQNAMVAATTCHYFGPIDKESKTGNYITYTLEAVDEKTGKRSPILPGVGQPPRTASWTRLEEEYQITNEASNGDSVLLRVLPKAEQPGQASREFRSETHRIACDGYVDSAPPPARYVDDKDSPCSEDDPSWKINFTYYLANKPAVPAVSYRTGHQVQYNVDGSHVNSASLTYRNATGGTNQMTVKLPWTLTFAGQPGQFVYLSAQNTDDWGSIECTILLDGVPVRRADSNSPYGIASVSGTVPLDHAK